MQTNLLFLGLAVVILILSAVLVMRGKSEQFKYTPKEKKAMCNNICTTMAQSPLIGGKATYDRCSNMCAGMFDDDTVVPAPYVTPIPPPQ